MLSEMLDNRKNCYKKNFFHNLAIHKSLYSKPNKYTKNSKFLNYSIIH